MSKLTYIRCGDYDIPNLKLSEQPETSIGKYGRMRKSYLKEHRPILYNHLLMSEKLYPHLLEIERTAQGACGHHVASHDGDCGCHGRTESL